MSANDIMKNIQGAIVDYVKSDKNYQDLIMEDLGNPIPTGIQVYDVLSGGGIPRGVLMQIVGRPGCGKSAFAGNVMAALNTFDKRSASFYIDTELSTTADRLKDLGVPKPAAPMNIMEVEKILGFVDKVANFKKENMKEAPEITDVPIYIIWDSVANTITERHFETDNINQVIGYRANYLSQMLPKRLLLLKNYNMSLIAINQVRDKLDMGMFGTPNTLKYMENSLEIPGGKSFMFNTQQLLIFKQGKPIDEEKYGFTGFECEAWFVKNKRFSPFIKFKMIFNHNHGFNNFWTNWYMLTTEKLTKQFTPSAYNKIPGYDKSFRIKEAEILYNTDQQFKKCWDELVEKGLKILLDKFSTTKLDDELEKRKEEEKAKKAKEKEELRKEQQAKKSEAADLTAANKKAE